MRHIHRAFIAWALFSASYFTHAASLDAGSLPDQVVERITARHKKAQDPMPQVLAQKLDEVDTLLGTMDAEEKGRAQTKGKPALAAMRTDRAPTVAAYQAELKGLQEQALSRIASERVRASDAATQTALDKLDTKVRDRFAQAASVLDRVRMAPPGQRSQALAAARAVFRKLHPPRQDSIPFIPTWSAGKPPAMLPQKKSPDFPQYLASPYRPGNDTYAFLGDTLLAALPPATPAEAATCAYSQADLDPTLDVVIDQEIRDLAEKLEYSPTKILKWMHDNIRFEPYYGSLKGSKGTLVAQAGGPTDQASLMIALLRASNIPARYVKGKVNFVDTVNPGANARAMRWLGAKSGLGAGYILLQGLFPEVALAPGDTGVSFVHVWVEACVPYGHYRGAKIDNAGHRWVPLDPSIRDNTYRADVDVSATMNYTNYLAQRRNGPNSLPQEYFAENHVKPALPAGKTLEDLGYTPILRPMKIDILPATLPYNVIEFRQWGGGINSPETAALPDTHRYKLAATVQTGAGATLINAFTMNMPDIALKRLTFRYKGAEALAQTGSISCTGIQGRPALLLEGVEQTQGSGTVDVCSRDNKLTLTLSHGEVTGGTVNSVTYSSIKAADYHALQAYAFQASDRLLTERAKKLIDSVNAIADPDTQLEATEGEYLHLVGLKYMRHLTDAGKRVGALTNGSGESGNHIGLTAARTKVDYLFDLPFAVTRDGFLVDVPGGRSRNVDLTDGSLRWDPFLLSGYSSSAYESYIWQENARMDAVSTVRGLQFARETGIEVLSLTSANWAAESPKLTSNTVSSFNYSSGQVNGIKTNYIDQGYTLTIPRQLIQYETWKGYVFAAEKNALPASAGASFIISGDYAGGYTFSAPIPYVYSAPLNTGYIFGLTVPSIMFPTAGLPPVAIGGGLIGNGFIAGITSTAGDPVNLVTGNFYHVERDLSIPGRGGLPLVFERSYNNRAAKNGPLGYGWTHSFNHKLKFYGVESGVAKVSWIDATGNEKFFSTAAHASGNISVGAILTNPAGSYVKFERLSDGRYKIIEKNGLAYTFESVTGPVSPPAAGSEPVARLLEIRDRNSNTLSLGYAGNGRASCTTGSNLAKVTDGVGRELHLCYDGANHITSLFDWTNREYRYAYDANGDLVSFKNPLAVTSPASQPPVQYQYYTVADGQNLAHAMKQYTLPRGNGMKFEYYVNGRVFRHYTLPNNETTSFRYNDFRRETLVTNERGRTRSHFFDEWGNPIAIIEENGASHAYTYDPANPYNRLTKLDPLGLRTQYQYDALGNVTRVTAPSGATTQFFDFNAFNQPQRIQDARGNWTLLAYDARGNLTDEVRLTAGITPSNGVSPSATQVAAWNQRAFDAFGNLTQSKRLRDFSGAALANINSGVGPSVTTAFDASGLYPVSITRLGDKNGDGLMDSPDSATLLFDSLGRQKQGIDATWQIVTADYDLVDRVIRATDATGRPRDYRFDVNGNRILEQLIDGGGQVDSRAWGFNLSDRNDLMLDAGGHATRTAYDAGGNPLTITNPDGYSLAFDYDASSRWVRAYDQAGHAVTRDLDLEGKPRTVTDPNGNSKTFDYWDASHDGRLKRETGATGRYAEYNYDANGNVVSITDQLARISRNHYDELNRRVRSVGPQEGAAYPVTCFKYDALSRVTELWAGSTTDPNASACDLTGADPNLKRQASYQYDDFDRKLKETDALNRQQTWAYDVNSNVVRYTDAKNQSTDYVWDYGHQLKTQIVKQADGSVYRTHSYTRNALGQITRTEIKDGANALVLAYDYRYDKTHRLQSLTDSRGSKTLSYDYSPGGLLNKMVDSDYNETDYLYDATGRLAGIWAPNYDYVAFSYDAGGRLIEKWFPNGVDAQYAWNADDSLASVANRVNSVALTSHVYSYDGAGRRQTQAETINGATKSWSYGYDNLDRLTSANEGSNTESYGYDYLNNRKTKTSNGAILAYVYDAANQLAEIRSGSDTGAVLAALTYDANGDLTSKTGSGPLTLAWNAKRELSTANGETYEYDDQGRRIKKTVGAATTHYLYNGPDIHAELNSAYQVQAVYTHGPNWDDPLIRLTGQANQPAANARYYHQDGVNSAVAVTDNLGAITGTQRFDAWGNKTASTGTIAQYGYTGREPDATGLYYYRARYYDPTIGRFVSRDPIGLNGGVNLYAYVNNSPVIFTDPSGNEAFAGAAIDPQAVYASLKSAWKWISTKYDRAVQIADQTAADAKSLALSITGGDKVSASILLHNGQIDAWRHAEWNRRMAADPQVGLIFSTIAGYGHEAANLKDKILGNGAAGQTWTQFSQETFMDLSNNKLGRTRAEQGVPVISLNDSGLIFGAGGAQGQPNLSFSDYVNASNSSYFTNMQGAGGSGRQTLLGVSPRN